MGHLWLRIKIWSKVILVAALFGYIIVFTYENAQEKVQFWYWYKHQPQTNLLLLVLFTFLAGMIAALLLRTLLRTIHQVQDVQSRSRSQRIDREIADIKTKAAMLQTRPAPAAREEPRMADVPHDP